MPDPGAKVVLQATPLCGGSLDNAPPRRCELANSSLDVGLEARVPRTAIRAADATASTSAGSSALPRRGSNGDRLAVFGDQVTARSAPGSGSSTSRPVVDVALLLGNPVPEHE